MILNNDILERISKETRIAILTGAGVSKESGVATFRDEDGLWQKFRPEELANFQAFISNPDLVWDWYQYRRSIVRDVKPNPGHYAIAELERLFAHVTLITQNVDNLHGRAGSRNILEIHGNIDRNYCISCRKRYDNIEFKGSKVPQCECGGLVRPDVVWFGEMLAEEMIQQAFKAAESADIFFSVGTSALVYPAAHLPISAKQSGALLVEINPSETPLTHYADQFIRGKSGEILPEIVKELANQI